MFELEVKDVFKITGRGYVIAGEITENGAILRNGDISDEAAKALVGKRLCKE
ncbi:hypothetical protein [Paenibacillus tyrfis]|uniref:hypothetical protein n=1 Tax=Paenibacillus tyrfis TaxID=1501230 RepID=UPI0015C637A2|nr:hypothetical protein [Paenibacillus tyrfis]